MKTLLVTGGAGFIGSNFIKYMMKKYKNYKILNLDLLTYAGNLGNLKELDSNNDYEDETAVAQRIKRYEFVKGDIADKDLIKELFDKYSFDYVINFAAESHVDRSIENPEIFVRTNVMGTQVLLDNAMRSWQVGRDDNGYPVYRDGVKFLQISTDEVYGTLGEEGLFTEETPLAPNSPYAASKACADLLVRSYLKTYKLPVNITRCSNNYGPNQHPEKLIPKTIINALRNEVIPVYGDGKNIRDWLYVEDHCNAIDLVLHKGKIGEIYNIGGNNERTNMEIVKLILEKLEKPQSLIKYVEDRLGHDRRYAIDSTKIQRELGWDCKYKFDCGIELTIDFYKNRNLR